MSKFDLSGKKFYRLTVLSKSKPKDNKNSYWLCQCKCGKLTIVSRPHLIQKHTRSCGCLAKETKISKNTTHGMTLTPEYQSWSKMKSRCLNKNDPNYKNYGGRGISVCDKWVNSFQNFHSDLGLRPNKNYTIDRINNNGNYEPSNCRWATKYTQSNNRSNNIKITLNSLTMNASQWAEQLGIKSATIRARLKAGWSQKDSLKV